MRLRLGQLAERLRLADETLQRPGKLLRVILLRRNPLRVDAIGDIPRKKLLDGDRIFEHMSLGTVNDAEGAESQGPGNIVPADIRAVGERCLLSCAWVHR